MFQAADAGRLSRHRPTMPALIDIRRRIRSVKNTQQITKAMKMVSAAKLRRAQEAMFAARPYARKMLEVLNSLATPRRPRRRTRCCRQRGGGARRCCVVVTADKGLAGGFNANIIRAATRFLEEHGAGPARSSWSWWAARAATSSAAALAGARRARGRVPAAPVTRRAARWRATLMQAYVDERGATRSSWSTTSSRA